MTTPGAPGTFRRVPLYRQAADGLRDLILSGQFGDVLPSQDELRQILQVSRPTVREAIRVLERTGLVSTRQGVATVINHGAPRLNPGLEELLSTTDLIKACGYSPGTTHVDIHRTVATKGTYPIFDGLSVLVVERVRTANGVPFVYSVDVIPDHDDLDALKSAVAEGSLTSWLQSEGLEVTYAKATLIARSADKMLAERLNVARGTALLLSEEVGYGAQDQAIYYSHDFYRCDLTQFYVVRRRHGQ